jgi:hypothetical protein
MKSDQQRDDVVPGWSAVVVYHVDENTEVTDKWEDGWLQRPFYSRLGKEMKTRWMPPSLADQTAGLERWLVVV